MKTKIITTDNHRYSALFATTVMLSSFSVTSLSATIEEIIVTAQKREQSSQDIGVAITAFGGEDLKDMGIRQPVDIAAQTPGVDIKNTLGKVNPVITIRGVGLNDYHSNNNPSTAVHVDEVYLGSSAYLSFQLFDVERVEVLKGPQGTLYGRNTTAGAVNFITKKPTEEFDASVDVSYGNYNSFSGEFAFGGQLTESINGRVALMVDQSDGYVENRGTVGFEGYTGAPGKIEPLPLKNPDDEASSTDAVAWRASFTIEPHDNLDIFASIHGSKDDSNGYILQVDGPVGSFDGGVVSGESSRFIDTDSDPFTRYDNSDTRVDSEALGGQLRIDAHGESVTFSSITGYEELDRNVVDGDGHPLRLLEWDWYEDMYQFTQEFRLTSNGDGDLHWIAGVFYSDEEIDFQKNAITADWLLTDINTEYVQGGESLAVFGHTEWQFSEAWKLTLGLRYTEEEKDYRGGTYDLDPYGATIFFPGGGAFAEADEDYDTQDISGKIALDWTPANDVLIYGSISKGFKSGGFDGSTVFDSSDVTPFEEETLWAYELGFKTSLFENSLQFNGAVFFYDYQDMQAEATVTTIVDGVPLPSSIRTNAGDVEMTGAEFDILWLPGEGWDIRAGVSLIDSEVVTWNSVNPAERRANEGNQSPDAPELTFNGRIQYAWELANGLNLTASTNFNFVDDTFKDIYNTPAFAADSYWVVDGRLALSDPEDNWQIALWGKNLADEEYVVNRFETLNGEPGSSWTWYGAPRTYGINLRYNWQ
ncbi:TonB-dependent receptor [Pseudomaricurvus alkylphenolicus]|uniref:TonB-dependent receptor n=1 Tax=Pseudomaricurvus alkylphenolicus TaxID=1306991 RepID=UPI0014209BBB|nr:TonB-dependent receptor [Pseudomaricurvus alkylphenolicus]NIB38269.1 TonB-dependent receptor [Pseudomaricurvus alkylphenolicus]